MIAERVGETQRAIGAQIDNMTPAQRESAINQAWWKLENIYYDLNELVVDLTIFENKFLGK